MTGTEENSTLCSHQQTKSILIYQEWEKVMILFEHIYVNCSHQKTKSILILRERIKNEK